jgi:hypothetical protein
MKNSIAIIMSSLIVMLFVIPGYSAVPDGTGSDAVEQSPADGSADQAVLKESGEESDGSKDPGGFVVTGTGGNQGWLGDSSYGVYGEHTGGNYGHLGSNDYGAYGFANNANRAAIYGSNISGSYGYLATESYGVRGYGSLNGHYGYLGGEDHGVYGYAAESNGNGVYGENINGKWGVLGDLNFGVQGYNPGSGYHGSVGAWDAGAKGRHNDSDNEGRLGTLNYAGYFVGNVDITGTLAKGGGSFKIDHPLDPENKYLYHSFVESPDMMNVYNGNIILDETGEATVTMPDWFEVLNRDFRYQLTAIGAPGPNLYIAEEMSDNRFRIAGGEASMKVSWQVTGIRHDLFAEANRIPVEKDKSQEEIGKYQHPELYGHPREMGVGYSEPPQAPAE